MLYTRTVCNWKDDNPRSQLRLTNEMIIRFMGSIDLGNSEASNFCQSIDESPTLMFQIQSFARPYLIGIIKIGTIEQEYLLFERFSGVLIFASGSFLFHMKRKNKIRTETLDLETTCVKSDIDELVSKKQTQLLLKIFILFLH